MRVPGLRSRIFGRSFRLMLRQRNIVITERLGEIAFEQIVFGERRLVADTLLGGVALRQLDHVRIVLDAMGARAAFGGRDDRAAVARAEIDHVIARRDFAPCRASFDQRIRRRHPDDIFSRLADARLVSGCAGWALTRGAKITARSKATRIVEQMRQFSSCCLVNCSQFQSNRERCCLKLLGGPARFPIAAGLDRPFDAIAVTRPV